MEKLPQTGKIHEPQEHREVMEEPMGFTQDRGNGAAADDLPPPPLPDTPPFLAELEKAFGQPLGNVGYAVDPAMTPGTGKAGPEWVKFADKEPKKELIAHEFAHVVAMRGGNTDQPGRDPELEARTAAAQAMRGERANVPAAPSAVYAGEARHATNGGPGQGRRTLNNRQGVNDNVNPKGAAYLCQKTGTDYAQDVSHVADSALVQVTAQRTGLDPQKSALLFMQARWTLAAAIAKTGTTTVEADLWAKQMHMASQIQTHLQSLTDSHGRSRFKTAYQRTQLKLTQTIPALIRVQSAIAAGMSSNSKTAVATCQREWTAAEKAFYADLKGTTVAQDQKSQDKLANNVASAVGQFGQGTLMRGRFLALNIGAYDNLISKASEAKKPFAANFTNVMRQQPPMHLLVSEQQGFVTLALIGDRSKKVARVSKKANDAETMKALLDQWSQNDSFMTKGRLTVGLPGGGTHSATFNRDNVFAQFHDWLTQTKSGKDTSDLLLYLSFFSLGAGLAAKWLAAGATAGRLGAAYSAAANILGTAGSAAGWAVTITDLPVKFLQIGHDFGVNASGMTKLDHIMSFVSAGLGVASGAAGMSSFMTRMGNDVGKMRKGQDLPTRVAMLMSGTNEAGQLTSKALKMKAALDRYKDWYSLVNDTTKYALFVVPSAYETMKAYHLKYKSGKFTEQDLGQFVRDLGRIAITTGLTAMTWKDGILNADKRAKMLGNDGLKSSVTDGRQRIADRQRELQQPTVPTPDQTNRDARDSLTVQYHRDRAARTINKDPDHKPKPLNGDIYYVDSKGKITRASAGFVVSQDNGKWLYQRRMSNGGLKAFDPRRLFRLGSPPAANQVQPNQTFITHHGPSGGMQQVRVVKYQASNDTVQVGTGNAVFAVARVALRQPPNSVGLDGKINTAAPKLMGSTGPRPTTPPTAPAPSSNQPGTNNSDRNNQMLNRVRVKSPNGSNKAGLDDKVQSRSSKQNTGAMAGVKNQTAKDAKNKVTPRTKMKSAGGVKGPKPDSTTPSTKLAPGNATSSGQTPSSGTSSSPTTPPVNVQTQTALAAIDAYIARLNLALQLTEEAITQKMRELPMRQKGQPSVWVLQQGNSYKVGLFGTGEVGGAFGKLKPFVKPMAGTPAVIDQTNFSLLLSMESPAADLSRIAGVISFAAANWKTLLLQNKLGTPAQVVAGLSKLDPSSLSTQMMSCFGVMTLPAIAFEQLHGLPNLVDPFQMPPTLDLPHLRSSGKK